MEGYFFNNGNNQNFSEYDFLHQQQVFQSPSNGYDSGILSTPNYSFTNITNYACRYPLQSTPNNIHHNKNKNFNLPPNENLNNFYNHSSESDSNYYSRNSSSCDENEFRLHHSKTETIKPKKLFTIDSILGDLLKNDDKGSSQNENHETGKWASCNAINLFENTSNSAELIEESLNNSKKNVKNSGSKRVRTIFTQEQLDRLEFEFERQQYMVGDERVMLANELNLNELQVKIWFQNRRIKWRKDNIDRKRFQAGLTNVE